jgi:hypothetical protein
VVHKLLHRPWLGLQALGGDILSVPLVLQYTDWHPPACINSPGGVPNFCRGTAVEPPSGCRLGVDAPPCKFVLQTFDAADKEIRRDVGSFVDQGGGFSLRYNCTYTGEYVVRTKQHPGADRAMGEKPDSPGWSPPCALCSSVRAPMFVNCTHSAPMVSAPPRDRRPCILVQGLGRSTYYGLSL